MGGGSGSVGIREDFKEIKEYFKEIEEYFKEIKELVL